MSTSPTGISNYGTLINTLENGQLSVELDGLLRDLVAALHDAYQDRGGKPVGSIALTLAFRLEGGVIEVVAKPPKAVMPPAPRARTIMWATPDNALSLSDPRQRSMFESHKVLDAKPMAEAKTL